MTGSVARLRPRKLSKVIMATVILLSTPSWSFQFHALAPWNDLTIKYNHRLLESLSSLSMSPIEPWRTADLKDLGSSLLDITDNNAWENPATERIKSMAIASLWGVPLAVVLAVILTAVVFSTVMPVIDRMFYSNLEEEMQAYLPSQWAEYQDALQLSGESLSSRKELQMEMWDLLADFKAERLREMYLSRLGDEQSSTVDKDYYESIWEQALSLLEEGEELENRPDLIAMLEEGLLKSPSKQETGASNSTPARIFQAKENIVGTELNRVDLIMRLFDKTTEFSGKSRRRIYQDWDEAHKT